MKDRRSSTWATWRVPIVLGLITAGGLLFALLGDGPADILSWAALGVPVLASGWILWPARGRSAAER